MSLPAADRLRCSCSKTDSFYEAGATAAAPAFVSLLLSGPAEYQIRRAAVDRIVNVFGNRIGLSYEKHVPRPTVDLRVARIDDLRTVKKLIAVLVSSLRLPVIALDRSQTKLFQSMQLVRL